MVEHITHKGITLPVYRSTIKNLDQSKLSNKFKSHNFPPNHEVFIKCNEDGSPQLRGKRQEYRMLKATQLTALERIKRFFNNIL